MILTSEQTGCSIGKANVRNFTLVEIMMVCLVIAILMGIGLGVYSGAMSAGKRAKTQATIKKLEVTLENLKTKYGVYPQTTDTTDPYFYLDGLTREIGTGSSSKYGMGLRNMTDYDLDFKKGIDYESIKSAATKDMGSGKGGLVLVDAWGNPLIYICPGIHNKNSFDIISRGSDGRYGDNGTGPDLTASPQKANNEGQGDDLTNFNGSN